MAAATLRNQCHEYKGGRELRVRAEGSLVFNTIPMMAKMALAGLGLATLPEDVVQDHVKEGTLVRVLVDWSAPALGYHLYYPSRRQPTPAFALLVNTLRYPRKLALARNSLTRTCRA